jgi:hypothetical protein
MQTRKLRLVLLSVLSLLGCAFLLPEILDGLVGGVTTHYQYFNDTSFPSQTKHLGANNHVDTRFTPQTAISIDETRLSLRNLLASFTTFMLVNHFDFWIAHGTLLGWYWNEKLLPWDTDVDVQVRASTLAEMVDLGHNQSIFPWTGEWQNNYLLDINPFFNTTDVADPANTIDARWIDMTNGKFLDITAVHQKGTRWICKDGHQYRLEELSPLRPANIEKLNISVPQQPERILRKEYGLRALRNEHFHWHFFNRTSRLWEPEALV